MAWRATSRRSSAGGGIRTHMFFRTRAPKTRASTNCATPASGEIVPIPTCQTLPLVWFQEVAVLDQSGGGIRARQTSHRGRLNDCAIARLTGIPRGTVRDWRREPPESLVRADPSSPCGTLHDFDALPEAAYTYLLGMYLGDGWISRSVERGGCEYPATRNTRPSSTDVAKQRHGHSEADRVDGEAEGQLLGHQFVFESLALSVASTRTRSQAPQTHRVGSLAAGHRRPRDRGIRPGADSQRRVPSRRERSRGHSVRYHFSNRSEDIIGLFTAALDLLGITWTRSDDHTVSIYRKEATAMLDEFVRPKDSAVPLYGVHYAA